MKQLTKKTLPVLTAILCLLLASCRVTATEGEAIAKNGSIEIHYFDGETNLEGARFLIYQVAVLRDSNEPEITDTFSGYPFDFNPREAGEWRALAKTLEAYIVRDGIEPLTEQSIDSSGRLVFADLRGLYLVRGEPLTADGNLYTPEPVLVMLPFLDENHNVMYDVCIEPKKDIVPQPEKISVSVVKVWKDGGREDNRPSEVAAELLKDGNIYETIMLNKTNNWRYVWNELDGRSTYTVTEKDVSDKYTVLIEREGSAYVITNTVLPDAPAKPDNPKLPQTGMFQWPVPILAAAGILTLLAGIFDKKRSKTNKKTDSADSFGKVLSIVGAILIIGAASLFTYNRIGEARAGDEAAELLEQIKAETEAGTSSFIAANEMFRKTPEIEMPVMEINGKACVGTVIIPSLQLELPVLENWSYENLKISPCRWHGSAYMDNMVIAAHNYKTHFGGIHSLKEGDRIYFYDADGNRFDYSVAAVEVLSPHSVEAMKEDKWNLSLFTCTYGGQSRVTVRCLKTGEDY